MIVWLSQKQLVELFQSSKANISEHIKAICDEGELDEASTVRKIRTVQDEGSREVSRNITYYNLDMIISLGYRVHSHIATQFRRWATEHRQAVGKALDEYRKYQVKTLSPVERDYLRAIEELNQSVSEQIQNKN